ncbi:hypothetical protein PHLCEN_2v11572 [Hermanssonia centrifuga]|uniref:Uncharacterized protein n=1 Tax=Hermanssonia centrifuga TaxID=98765 RepID=A0A2R6NJN0_9APHY|nr:hypothetical protein PHLCEN_2v11572 [Hermanssonia centrifuga]
MSDSSSVADTIAAFQAEKWTGVTWLFLANRYIMVIGIVLANLPSTSPQKYGVAKVYYKYGCN